MKMNEKVSYAKGYIKENKGRKYSMKDDQTNFVIPKDTDKMNMKKKTVDTMKSAGKERLCYPNLDKKLW